MLGQRRKRWANIDQTLGRCVVFAGTLCNFDCISSGWKQKLITATDKTFIF